MIDNQFWLDTIYIVRRLRKNIFPLSIVGIALTLLFVFLLEQSPFFKKDKSTYKYPLETQIFYLKDGIVYGIEKGDPDFKPIVKADEKILAFDYSNFPKIYLTPTKVYAVSAASDDPQKGMPKEIYNYKPWSKVVSQGSAVTSSLLATAWFQDSNKKNKLVFTSNDVVFVYDFELQKVVREYRYDNVLKTQNLGLYSRFSKIIGVSPNGRYMAIEQGMYEGGTYVLLDMITGVFAPTKYICYGSCPSIIGWTSDDNLVVHSFSPTNIASGKSEINIVNPTNLSIIRSYDLGQTRDVYFQFEKQRVFFVDDEFGTISLLNIKNGEIKQLAKLSDLKKDMKGDVWDIKFFSLDNKIVLKTTAEVKDIRGDVTLKEDYIYSLSLSDITPQLVYKGLVPN